jgi:anti-sigma-K factor RskA
VIADNGHIDDLAAAYALGALEPHEVERVVKHIAVCARCRHMVDEERAVTDFLAYGVPVVAPPAGLKEQIGRQLPLQVVSAEPANRRRGGWETWWRPAASLLAATIVIAVGLAAWEMRQELETAQTRTQALAPSATKEAELLSMVVAPQSTTIPLRPVTQDGNAHGKLLVDYQQNRGLLIVRQMPQLRDGTVYQVWLSHEQAQTPAGTLHPNGDGSGTLELTMPQDFALYRWLSVTVEHEPGNTEPAGEVVLLALLD